MMALDSDLIHKTKYDVYCENPKSNNVQYSISEIWIYWTGFPHN